MPARWMKGLKPDPSVLEFVKQLEAAAKRGQIRAITAVIITPTLTVEDSTAGDLDNVRQHLLVGGLFKAANKLTDNGK